MKISDLKYLASFLIPLAVFIGLTHTGIVSVSPLIFAFIILPILEMVIPRNSNNLSETEYDKKDASWFFEALLYLNIPIVASLLYLYFISMPNFIGAIDWIGNTGSMALLLSTSGINVAHELGHKNSKVARTAAKMLLLPSHYMHFIIEHNLGHHLNVSTPEDPATARKNENIYFFWFRSTFQSYMSAWKIENKILNKKGKRVLSLRNRMVQFFIIQVAYLSLIFFFFGIIALYAAIIMGIFSFLILETINYIEHYGLVRKKKANGKYEVVTHIHSWNSDHQLGRIILYELTRHSDHHYKSNKKYQLLESHEGSPELPFGYPGSLILTLIPPLWFWVMNKRVEKWSLA